MKTNNMHINIYLCKNTVETSCRAEEQAIKFVKNLVGIQAMRQALQRPTFAIIKCILK